MKKRQHRLISSINYLECYGNFEIEDQICLNSCALNMRCAIEKDKNSRLELLDELFSSENIHETIQ